MPFIDPTIPELPSEKRTSAAPAYPKDLVASMHAMLQLQGRAKFPIRIVIESQDAELLREHHLSQLPKDQSKYTPLHWAMLRHTHAGAEQRDWLKKQIATKE